MVGGDSKRKCPPEARKVGPLKKRRNTQKIQPKSHPHFQLSKANLKKRKRSSTEDDMTKDVETAEVKVIEVVLDDDEDEEEESGREMKDDSSIELLMSSPSSPEIDCEYDVSENVKRENEARVKEETVDNTERELHDERKDETNVREDETDGREDATGWLTIPSLPLGWKFREVANCSEVPVKASTPTTKEMDVEVIQEVSTISTSRRQFILAPTGKIFPCRFFYLLVLPSLKNVGFHLSPSFFSKSPCPLICPSVHCQKGPHQTYVHMDRG